MKNIKSLCAVCGIILFVFSGFLSSIVAQDTTSIMDLESSTKGVLLPRLSTAEREAIANPANSLTVYDTDTETFWYYQTNKWVKIKSNIVEESGGENTTSIPIPLTGTISSTIDITSTDIISAATTIEVCINISHSWTEDLDISLESPSGTETINLSSDNGSLGINYSGTCFTTYATTPITSGSAPFTGNYSPEGSWSVFFGVPMDGTWKLIVHDDESPSSGTLLNWSIRFSSPEQSNAINVGALTVGGDALFVQNNRVGIGTTSPGSSVSNAKLDVAGGHILVDNNFGIFSKKVDGSLAAGFDTDVNNALYLYTDGASRMSVGSNGYVGIGTSTSNWPLQVVGSAPIGANAEPNYWLHSVSGHGGPGASSGWSYSIHASGGIYSGLGFGTGSDARIKYILGKSDAQQDLSLLMNIDITDYKMKDALQHGDAVIKKVIAQQVESVLSNAVTKTIGIIPDIYQKASVENGWIQLSTNLKEGEKVKIITQESEEVYTVSIVQKNRFKVDDLLLSQKQEDVFIFGREVDDFRSVDYDAISMLHVSATQEQQRLIEAQQKEIKKLKEENSQMRSDIADIKISLAN